MDPTATESEPLSLSRAPGGVNGTDSSTPGLYDPGDPNADSTMGLDGTLAASGPAPPRVPPAVLRLRALFSSPAPDSLTAAQGASAASPGGEIQGEAEGGGLGRPASALSLPRPPSFLAFKPFRAPGGIPQALSQKAFAQTAATFEHETEDHFANKKAGWGYTLLLAYFTIGTIYGDIGTSPLYTMSSILGTLSDTPTDLDLLGAASLCFWLLTLSPLIKYVFIVLYADDLGEGGTFAVYSNLCRHARISLLGSRVNREEEEEMVRLYSNSLTDSPNRVQPGAEEDEGQPGASGSDAQAGSQRKGPKQAWWLPRGSGRFARAVIERYWWLRQALLLLALLGTCGVLADGVLTPAISVLSAVQGLGTAGASLSQDAIIGITCAILAALFIIQKLGTSKISFAFSPVVLLWFFSIASIGIYNIAAHNPGVFKAISPWYSFNFLVTHGFTGWVSLGQVVLSITGSEALFADMGHFSRASIQIAFSLVVYPSVILAYFGQAAYASQNIDQIGTLFYSSVPSSLFWPMFVVATLAAVVASQALISGAFSVIKQSMALSCFPRVKILHTSVSKEGQIYIPLVNWTLMVLTIAVVAGFQNGTAIGNAYGVTVVMVMMITTILVSTVMLVSWDLSIWVVLPFFVFYLGLESVIFSSTLYKVPQGGWFPLVLSMVLLILMYTWHYGTYKKKHYTIEHNLGERHLYTLLSSATDVEGVAVVYSDMDDGVPPVLLHYLANVPSLQKVVICLTVKQLAVPRLDHKHRMLIAPMAYRGKAFPGLYRVIVYYGYTEPWDHGHEFLGTLRAALAANIAERNARVGSATPALVAAASTGAFSPATQSAVEATFQEWEASGAAKGKEPEGAGAAAALDVDDLELMQVESLLSAKTWRLPGPGQPGSVSEDRLAPPDELDLLNSAWEYNQIFFMGRTVLVPAEGASIFTKVAVPAYSFLKGLTSTQATLFGVPSDRLLEVGMIYKVQ